MGYKRSGRVQEEESTRKSTLIRNAKRVGTVGAIAGTAGGLNRLARHVETGVRTRLDLGQPRIPAIRDNLRALSSKSNRANVAYNTFKKGAEVAILAGGITGAGLSARALYRKLSKKKQAKRNTRR